MKLGVIGSLVWDIIHDRDPAAPPVEEWGGIAYALSSLDAHLAPGWEIVPLIKVGRDLSQEAAKFLGTLSHLTPNGRCVDVDVPNNRVVLRYQSTERRCERMSGGVPSWNWTELGPMVRDLDALYVNFISGFEMCMGTAMALRQGFRGPIYCDLHSLFLGMQRDGIRTLQPLPDIDMWFSCFDYVQMNEEEMQQVGGEPMEVAARALAAGVKLLTVTVGPRGAVYFKAVDKAAVDGASGRSGTAASPAAASTPAASSTAPASASVISTARIPPPRVEAIDPTGCGDVFGGALAAHLFNNEPPESAIRQANEAAARNATYRGAGGLARFLKGEYVLT